MKIITSNRRFVSRVKRHKVDDMHFEPYPSDIDNHADTICFGKNFRPIYFTSEVCQVSPFLEEYQQQDDIQICTAATAVDLDDGETIILQFGQGLWFGNRMNRSLINPNQCRSYGISICDDPTDAYRDLGIDLGNGYFLPMSMNGSTCSFTSRCPTEDELQDESLKWFTLSDEQHWDPTAVTFNSSRRNISTVEGRNYNTPVTHSIMFLSSNCVAFKDDVFLHEIEHKTSWWIGLFPMYKSIVDILMQHIPTIDIMVLIKHYFHGNGE